VINKYGVLPAVTKPAADRVSPPWPLLLSDMGGARDDLAPLGQPR
jgi:hypothetical protein